MPARSGARTVRIGARATSFSTSRSAFTMQSLVAATNKYVVAASQLCVLGSTARAEGEPPRPIADAIADGDVAHGIVVRGRYPFGQHSSRGMRWQRNRGTSHG